MGHMGLIALISLMSFVSCSKSDDFDELQNAPGAVIGGVNCSSTYFEENMSNTRSGGGLTRAWETPSGFTTYEGGYLPIAIAFTQDGVNPTAIPNPEDPEHPKSMLGYFFKVDENWRTTVDIDPAGSYYLYGFIPNHPDINYSITDYNGGTTNEEKNAEYSKGAIMKLENVPTVMPNDLCVVIGAKHGTDKEHDSGLRVGDFGFTASQGSDSQDYVFLLFDHLYASLSINMRVYDDYAKLRKIKLKSLLMSTKDADGNVSTKNTDITINIEKTADGSESPIKELQFDSTEGDAIDGDGIEFWSSTNGELLTTSYTPRIGHFMPHGITELVLISIYDVYDRKDNLIRENCKVMNTLKIEKLFDRQTVTARGKKYTVNMTILPTYLYVLSDPDLENPVVIDE